MRNNPIFLLHFNIYNMATFKVLLHSSNSIINQEDKLKKSFDYTLPGNSETDKGQSLTVFSSESSLLVPKDTTNLNIEQQFMDEIIEKAKKSSPIGTEKTWGSKVYINAGIG